jgi:hypothetical protein
LFAHRSPDWFAAVAILVARIVTLLTGHGKTRHSTARRSKEAILRFTA